MKDEQKVWIRGVVGRGSEVIKMLGGGNYLFGGDTPGYIYYISHDGEISFALAESEMAKIIMDNYRELHLPEQWKDGDMLTDCGNDFCVFRGYSEDSPDKFIAYISLQLRFLLRDDKPLFDKENYRLATQQEIEKFHELLHKLGKDWNAENKQLVSWKWKPKVGDYYYYISAEGDIIRYRWVGYPADERGFEFGNCFRTREEAEAMAEKIKKLLKGGEE